MSYLDAPATQMLATHCCLCNAPLVDAQSVERGIGPVCMKKLKVFLKELAPEVRAEVNKLIFRASVELSHGEVEKMCETARQIGNMGCHQVAAKILTATGHVVIEVEKVEDEYRVKAPYNVKFVEGGFRILGRRWLKAEKVTAFPVTARAKLFELLKACYAGATLTCVGKCVEL